jgi:hypothetical protein
MKDLEKFIDKVTEFIYNKENNFAGLARYGMYNVREDIFKTALKEYFKTGENVLDEYDKIIWQAWGPIGQPSEMRECWDKDELLFWEDALSKNTFWDIWSFYDSEDIQKLKQRISKTKARHKYLKSYKKRRKDACVYTSNPAIRRKVFKRDGKICKHCGVSKNLTLDHIFPVSKGGEDTMKNIQVLCRSCNSKKSNKIQCAVG